MYNMRAKKAKERGAIDFSDEDEEGAIVIRLGKKRLTRVIDEGVFNIK